MKNQKTSEERSDRRELGWMVTLGGVILIGLIIVAIFGLQLAPPADQGSAATTGLVLAGACMLIGALVGFLFGIPRTLQDPLAAAGDEAARAADQQEDRPSPANIRYQVNTNLEQISDWLTKILVGVGLTQLNEVPARLNDLANYLGPAFGGEAAGGDRFSIVVVLYFTTTGFLFAYLWTRLFLAGALAQADLSTVLRRVEQRIEKQTEIDAKALSLARRYLDPDVDSAEISVDALKKAVREASASVKVQIFYQAEEVRSRNWKKEARKSLMERTIPVFEALIESDKDQRFHKHHGQLGFALKDKREPQWKEAVESLSKAIRLRGDWKREGWVGYELNRAICRIMTDPDFLNKQPSSSKNRELILADLRIAASDEWARGVIDDQPIAEWRTLNKATEKELEVVRG